jgi:hypothetical protein
VVAVHATNRDIQPDATIKPALFSDLPTSALMNRNTCLSATTAARWRLRVLGQLQKWRAIRSLNRGINCMLIPEGKVRQSI